MTGPWLIGSNMQTTPQPIIQILSALPHLGTENQITRILDTKVIPQTPVSIHYEALEVKSKGANVKKLTHENHKVSSIVTIMTMNRTHPFAGPREWGKK